jgi:uncharacterized protein (UPF0333 family)
MRRQNKNTGQSTLEYMIVLTAIVAAVIVAAPKIKENTETAFTHAGEEMQSAVENIDYGGGEE